MTPRVVALRPPLASPTPWFHSRRPPYEQKTTDIARAPDKENVEYTSIDPARRGEPDQGYQGKKDRATHVFDNTEYGRAPDNDAFETPCRGGGHLAPERVKRPATVEGAGRALGLSSPMQLFLTEELRLMKCIYPFPEREAAGATTESMVIAQIVFFSLTISGFVLASHPTLDHPLLSPS